MLRRNFLLGIGGVAFTTVAIAPAWSQTDSPFSGEAFAEAIRAAEAQGGGRLGVAVLDTQTGHRFAWRGEERFPLASTFKFILAAAILAEVDAGRESLDRRVPIAASDMVEHAPVTEKHIGAGLTVKELCQATIVWSDNPAANLLLPVVGGPAGLTRFARNIGDQQFRLDRIETALGEGKPGDPRDTTTPLAMVGALERLLTGDVLSPASRSLLTDWLVACRTGDQTIRAGLPGDWRAGDKTGSAGYGTRNDVAILWPPARRPILVASYLTETEAPLEARNAALAAVGRAISQAVT